MSRSEFICSGYYTFILNTLTELDGSAFPLELVLLDEGEFLKRM